MEKYEKVKKNKLKTLAPTWDKKYEIPDESHFVYRYPKVFWVYKFKVSDSDL